MMLDDLKVCIFYDFEEIRSVLFIQLQVLYLQIILAFQGTTTALLFLGFGLIQQLSQVLKNLLALDFQPFFAYSCLGSDRMQFGHLYSGTQGKKLLRRILPQNTDLT